MLVPVHLYSITHTQGALLGSPTGISKLTLLTTEIRLEGRKPHYTTVHLATHGACARPQILLSV